MQQFNDVLSIFELPVVEREQSGERTANSSHSSCDLFASESTQSENLTKYITQAAQVAWYKTTESAQNTGPQKTSKEPVFGLQKIKPFLKRQKNSYIRTFGLFLVLMGPQNAFFGAMDCSLREASHNEQSIAPPK